MQRTTFSCWYALLITLAGMCYLASITFLEIPKENIRVIDTALGFVMGTIINTAIGWVLGSSKSSSDKTAIMEDKAKSEALK